MSERLPLALVIVEMSGRGEPDDAGLADTPKSLHVQAYAGERFSTHAALSCSLVCRRLKTLPFTREKLR